MAGTATGSSIKLSNVTDRQQQGRHGSSWKSQGGRGKKKRGRDGSDAVAGDGCGCWFWQQEGRRDRVASSRVKGKFLLFVCFVFFFFKS